MIRTSRRTPISDGVLLYAAAIKLRLAGAATSRRLGIGQRWTKTCERCGEEYQATKKAQRFCSGRCRVAAHRAGVSS